MINKIGIENFRIFKDYTEFELAPITILTGPNNSGKSSFIKFLLLLKEGIDNLNFEQGKLHNLESFDKVLNWDDDSDDLQFSFNLRNDYNARFTYKKGKLTYIKLFKNKSLLFEYYEQDDSAKEEGGFAKMDGFYAIKNFNINYLIDKIYSIDIANIEYEKLIKVLYGWNWKNVHRSPMPYKQVEKQYRDGFSSLNRDGLLYEISVDGVDVTDNYKKELLKFQEKFFKQIKIDYFRFDGSDLYGLSKINRLKRIVEDIKDIYHFKFFINYGKSLNIGEGEIEINYSPLGKFIFKQEFLTGDIDRYSEFESVNFFDINVLYLIGGMNLNLKDLHYISANRGSQKRVLSNKSENDIDEIILEFTKSKIIHKKFIEKAFSIIGITGELVIERHENVISVVKIKRGDKEISLADLGYGYSQVIPVILKIQNIYSKYNDDIVPMNLFENTLILEEPEANLHPNLQSKLAEVLVFAHKTFGIHFILETHSEYLIRKLQYLTAQKELKNNDAVIYYFNADEFVTVKEKKVKEIKIDEFGGLTDSFGSGFFDEATSLKFELLKLNQAQNN